MAKERDRESAAPRPLAGGALFRFFERHRFLRAMAVGAAAAAAALTLYGAGWLERLELGSYDARVRAMAPGGRSELVEIVDYDDATIRHYAPKWDRFGVWPRDVHADLVDFITRGRPKAIILDILFAEGGRSAEDRDFADACKRAGNVVLACHFRRVAAGRRDERYERLSEEESRQASLGPAVEGGFGTMHAATWPYEGLRRSCRALGSIHLETDADSVVRAVSPAVKHPDADGGLWLWPTLSTAAAWICLGERPAFDPGLMRLGGSSFPLGAAGRRLIYWYGSGCDLDAGREPRYRITPAYWVLRSVEDGKDLIDPAERFKGKVVLVATGAVGAHELRYTPLGHEPGLYIHAAAIENLLKGDSVRRAGGAWTVLAVLLLAALVALAFPGKGWQAALRGSGAYVLLAGGYLAGACFVYSRLHLWIDLVAPQIGAGLAFAGSLLAGYLVEGRQVRRFRRAFSRFLSPEILAEVSKNLDDLRPGVGRRCEVTMMFCDVRGFTPMSEKLEPEAVVEILDLYLEAMSEAIMANGGTLSKYLGDGIMAFWGAPQGVPDHASRAVRAALEMVRAQEELKRRLAEDGKPVFDIGIGLHTGPAVVGTVGSERRLDYTAIGDTVNLASRVEQLTKEFGVRIVVTGALARKAGDRFQFRELGSVRVKGRSAEVQVFELTGCKQILEDRQ